MKFDKHARDSVYYSNNIYTFSAIVQSSVDIHTFIDDLIAMKFSRAIYAAQLLFLLHQHHEHLEYSYLHNRCDVRQHVDRHIKTLIRTPSINTLIFTLQRQQQQPQYYQY